jgi:mono/diheme cytochrome c family protein
MQLTNMRLLSIGIGLALLAAACNRSPEHPGYIYFPDMTYSQAYESMTPNTVFADSQSQQLPVAGTIPRGYKPFHFENTLEDYSRAGDELENPLIATEDNISQGRYLYGIYCAICHGESGEGNGPIVQREKFPPPPTFFNDYMMTLPDGKMFYSVHFGKGLMGSYASQLSQEERWKVILYINKMQNDHAGAAPSPDEAATAMNN